MLYLEWLPITLTESKKNIEFTAKGIVFGITNFSLKNNTISISQINEYENFQTDNKGYRRLFEIKSKIVCAVQVSPDLARHKLYEVYALRSPQITMTYTKPLSRY